MRKDHSKLVFKCPMAVDVSHVWETNGLLFLVYLGFQGEFPVGVVEGKGFLSFQHLSQRSIDPQRLQVVGYLTTRPGQ